MLIVIYSGIFASGYNKAALWMLAAIVLIQTGLGIYGFVGISYNSDPECELDIISNSEQLRSETEGLKTCYDRTKDINFYLNANYPIITQTSSASGWLNGTPSSLVDEMSHLGYTEMYTRTLDCGGTALTDAFMGYKYAIINNSTYNEALYSKIECKEHLLKTKYSFPFGVIVNQEFNKKDETDFSYQNELYRFFSEKEEDLFYEIAIEESDVKLSEEDGRYHAVISYYLPEECIVYFYGLPYSEDSYKFFINGQEVLSPYLRAEDNDDFPTYYRNGFLDAGVYSGEVNIDIAGGNEEYDSIRLGYLPLVKFESFIESKSKEYTINSFEVKKNRLKFCINSERDGIIILPIAFSENWTAYRNSDKVEIISNINNAFVSLNIQKGINDIELKYNQKGGIVGLLLSFVGIILSVLIIRIDVSKNEGFNRVFEIAFWIVLVSFLVFVYIIPILSNIYYLIKEHIWINDMLTYL